MSDNNLPVDSYLDAAEHLRRPFHPNAIKFKVQSNAGLVVAYIDARLVSERLNKVIPHKWESRFEPYPGGKQIICHLTVDGLTRSDVGTQATGDRVDPVKAGYSDALKRAAVHFGIGVPIYAMAQVWMKVADGSLDGERPTLNKKQKGNKEIVEIPKEAERWLRGQYEKWVKDGSGKKFGEILDHGDEEGAVGDIEATPTEDTGGSESVEAPSREHVETVARISALYDQLPAGKRRGLSQSKFKQQLAHASDSEEELAKLEAEIRERAA